MVTYCSVHLGHKVCPCSPTTRRQKIWRLHDPSYHAVNFPIYSPVQSSALSTKRQPWYVTPCFLLLQVLTKSGFFFNTNCDNRLTFTNSKQLSVSVKVRVEEMHLRIILSETDYKLKICLTGYIEP